MDWKQLGNNLRFCRERQKYTQEEIGQYLGISQPAYNKYEKGETSLSMPQLEKLAALYGVEEYDLLHGSTDSLSVPLAFAFRKQGMALRTASPDGTPRLFMLVTTRPTVWADNVLPSATSCTISCFKRTSRRRSVRPDVLTKRFWKNTRPISLRQVCFCLRWASKRWCRPPSSREIPSLWKRF